MKYCMAILLALASFNSYAGLTKWVDSNGTVHYSDGPPPENVQSESVRLRSENASGDTESASGVKGPKTIFEMERDLNKERKARAEADKKAAQKEQETEAKRKNCEAAQNQLNTLRNAPRIATYDAEGNRSIMDDTTRAQNTKAAEDAVSEYCN
jgi:prophage DNA circulation protein